MKTVKAWAIVEGDLIALSPFSKARLWVYEKESDANADLNRAATGAEVVRVEIRALPKGKKK